MLTRQKVVLGLLDQMGGTVGRTVLVKLAFLLRRETTLRDDRTFYDFVPHKFGPFSFALYHELQALEHDGYVSSADDAFRLKQISRGLVREKVDELAWPAQCAVKSVVSRYGRMSQRSLVRDVYARYPWFAIRSNLTDLLPPNMPSPVKAQPAVYTAGYEGRSVDGFLNHLLESGIRTILDVRANPMSRKYGFAKRTLCEMAGRVGLGYHHLPDLGIPSDRREDLGDFESYQRLFDWYDREVLPQRSAAIDQLVGLLRQRPSVLVCMEKDVRCCHRGRLAIAAQKASGLPVKHL